MHRIFRKNGKKENAIFDEIIKQLPNDNDRFCIEHNRETNTFMVREGKKETKKDNIVTSI